MLRDKIAYNIDRPIIKERKLNTSFDIKTATVIKLAMRYLTADLLQLRDSYRSERNREPFAFMSSNEMFNLKAS